MNERELFDLLLSRERELGRLEAQMEALRVQLAAAEAQAERAVSVSAIEYLIQEVHAGHRINTTRWMRDHLKIGLMEAKSRVDQLWPPTLSSP